MGSQEGTGIDLLVDGLSCDLLVERCNFLQRFSSEEGLNYRANAGQLLCSLRWSPQTGQLVRGLQSESVSV